MDDSPETETALTATADAMQRVLENVVRDTVPEGSFACPVAASRPIGAPHHLPRSGECPWHTRTALRALDHGRPLCSQIAADEVFLLASTRLARDHPDARLSPRDLGLPPRHLLPVETCIQRP